MRRNSMRATAAAVGALAALTVGGPALAGHVHYVATPNGQCRPVAQGQTAISDPAHGGFHRFHDNVHLGATGPAGTDGDDNLGQGNAAAQVYKEGPAPAQCDGS